MRLNINQLKQFATGVADIGQHNGCIMLYRFTKEQRELYKIRSKDFYEKSTSTAGVRLEFITDSTSLFLKVTTSRGSSRKYFSFDVAVNGRVVGYLDNYSDRALPDNYPKADFPQGSFSKSFDLGAGTKHVCIYFPWSVSVAIEEISLDDGALVEPVEKKKKLLVFGDSITQGYDALRPSGRYASCLADYLGAAEYCKAIGGEVFFPELAQLKETFEPYYITIAYGTNDWYKTDETTFRANLRAFLSNVSANYPQARIFVITPIWRGDMYEQRAFGSFAKVEDIIVSTAADFHNISVISGFDFVPHDAEYFADLRLHPNEAGIDSYFDSLIKNISLYL